MSDPYALFVNPRHGPPGLTVLPSGGFRRAKAAIRAWPGYAPTPLLYLPQVADDTKLGQVRLKNEGERFGLGSFKALGGAYAVGTLVAGITARDATLVQDIIVTSATDGNHGRSVAWGAQRAGCQCVIFVHASVSRGRVRAIEQFGAHVIRIPGNYDDSVREAARLADLNGWHVVSDTSYPGYTEIPRDVMQGYRMMADEAADQWEGTPPTHVFIQAGVGGAAAAVSVQMRMRFSPGPKLVIVEPTRAACLLASARAGKPITITGEFNTIMAGLACGEPSLLAWQELERAAFAFMAVSDEAAASALKLLACHGIQIGESGVAGLAALYLAASDASAREALALTEDSRVMLFGTEGITDAEVFNTILNSRRS